MKSSIIQRNRSPDTDRTVGLSSSSIDLNCYFLMALLSPDKVRVVVLLNNQTIYPSNPRLVCHIQSRPLSYNLALMYLLNVQL